jgi:hypothetical protein
MVSETLRTKGNEKEGEEEKIIIEREMRKEEARQKGRTKRRKK